MIFNMVLAVLFVGGTAAYFHFGVKMDVGQAIFLALAAGAAMAGVILAIVYAGQLL